MRSEKSDGPSQEQKHFMSINSRLSDITYALYLFLSIVLPSQEIKHNDILFVA